MAEVIGIYERKIIGKAEVMFEYLKKLVFGVSKPQKKPLNLYQYKFLRYKEERDSLYPLNISKVHVPCKKGLISVVLPVFNGEDVVAQSIESVLMQTYSNFELIVINDGSTDETLKIIEEYAKKDSRIRVFDQENRKIPRTLSRGFNEATGEFLTWTSADNVMDKNFLEKMVNDLKNSPDTGMIFANMRLIDEKGKKLSKHGWFEFPLGSGNVIFPENTYELNTYANNTIGAAFMYRASAKEILGCYSSYKHTLEDYDYWMRMNSLVNIKHTEFLEPIYSYRWHDKSLTAKDKELGITKNRYKLMVLDDFRRDFYMTPLIWYIKSNSANLDAAKEFKNIAEKTGHLVVSKDDFSDIFLGGSCSRVCYISFGGEKEDICLPNDVVKICVNCEEKDADFDIFSSTLKKEATVRENGCPEYVFDDIQTMFSFVDAKAKNDIVYGLEKQISEEKNYAKKLSIVLCTHKIVPTLSDCFASLCEQSAKPEDYEIVFVNNDFKNKELKEFVQNMRKKYENIHIKYLTEPIKGLSYARNSGMWAAEGEYILYVDDDAIAEKSVVEETIRAFESDSEFGVVGGQVLLNAPDSAKDIVNDETIGLWSNLFIKGKEIREAKDYGEFPYGANFAVRAECLKQIGGFRCSYGRVGNNFAGGEETLVCFMMETINKKVGLNPASRVEHRVDEGRFTLEHIEKTAYSGIMTQYRLRRDLYAPSDWNDINVRERATTAEKRAEKEAVGTANYINNKAIAKAFREVLIKRQEDYDYLHKNVK